jgi:hypothetical protein
MLDPAIGKSNGVGAKDIAGSISCLSSVEGSLGVVILDSILVSVRLISVLRSRGVGRLGGISRGGSRGICWGRRRRRDRSIGSRSRGICRGRRGRRKRGIWLGCILGAIGGGRPVGLGVSTGHSHQGGDNESLKQRQVYRANGKKIL